MYNRELIFRKQITYNAFEPDSLVVSTDLPIERGFGGIHRRTLIAFISQIRAAWPRVVASCALQLA